MTMKEAMKRATATVESLQTKSTGCEIKPHYGTTRRDRGIRILYTDANGANLFGPAIADAVDGEYQYSAGFAVVWL